MVEMDQSPGGMSESTVSIFQIRSGRARKIFHHGLQYVRVETCNWYWNTIETRANSTRTTIVFKVRAFRDNDRFCFDAGFPDNAVFPAGKGLQADIILEYKDGRISSRKKIPDYRAYVSARPL